MENNNNNNFDDDNDKDYTHYLSLPIEQNYGNHLIQTWNKYKTPQENIQPIILDDDNNNNNNNKIKKSSSLKFLKKQKTNVITIVPPTIINKKYIEEDDNDNSKKNKITKCLRMEDYGKAIYRRNITNKFSIVENKNLNNEFDLIVSIADGHESVKFDDSCYLGGYELAKFVVENILFLLENSTLYTSTSKVDNKLLHCTDIINLLKKTYTKVGRLVSKNIQLEHNNNNIVKHDNTVVALEEHLSNFEYFWWKNLEKFKKINQELLTKNIGARNNNNNDNKNDNNKFVKKQTPIKNEDYKSFITKKVKIDNLQLPMLFYTNDNDDILSCAEYGCTSTTLLFKTIMNKMYVFVANLGDSDAFLFHYNYNQTCYDKVTKLTTTHDGRDLNEQKRILESVPPNLPANLLKTLKPKITYDKKKNKFYGKQMWPNNKKRKFEIALTRSFGHESFWKYFGVINTPDINYFLLNDQDVIIVATDGLWGQDYKFTQNILDEILNSLNKCLLVVDNNNKNDPNAFINFEKNIINYLINKLVVANSSIDNILLETILVKVKKTHIY